MARLGDVFERQITGEWGSECLENETGTNILRTTNFTSDGIINYNNVVVRSIENTKVQSKRLHYGDIILEKSGGTDKTPVGRVVFCDPYIETGTYLCNNFTQAMRVNSSMAVPKYVFYFMWNLHWSGKTELMQNKTTGIRNLQVKSYLNQSFPLPSLDEQRRIAATLDKVTGLISKRRQQLDKLDELVKARFVEMFGDRVVNNKNWNVKELRECATFYNGKAHEQVVNENGQYILVTSKFIASDQQEYRKTDDALFLLYQGDICMVMSDVPNGRALAKCILIDQNNKYTLNQRICCFRNYKTNAIFLFYLLNRHEYFLSFDDGDSQTNLRKDDILSCPIILPPIELQNQFASYVTQIDKLNATLCHSLEMLKTLKKSLMQEYFG